MKTSKLYKALCKRLQDQRARSADLPTAVCQIVVGENTPPEYVELIPAGSRVVARDGREFSNEDPQGVIDAFADNNLDIVIDWEHATEVKAPFGEVAPAAGWIVELQNRDGAIWGRVEWTESGAASLISREYRFISPAFQHDEDGVVLQIVSAGLTNRPALDLSELARQKGNKPMDKELLKLLGLPENATQEDVNKAIAERNTAQQKAEEEKAAAEAAAQEAQTQVEETQQQLAAATEERDSLKTALAAAKKDVPNAELFVPRSDYEAALNSIKRLEEDSKARAERELDEKVNAAVDNALKEGKITPASRDYHIASCKQEGGLERFSKFIETAPVIVKPGEIITDPVPENAGDVTLSATDLAVCRQTGISPEEFKKARKQELERLQGLTH